MRTGQLASSLFLISKPGLAIIHESHSAQRGSSELKRGG